MAAQAGKDLLLKVEDDALPGTYVAVGGFRSNSFTINGEGIDITNKDSNGFKEMLDGAGVRSVTASGTGVFMDDAIFTQVNTDVLAGSIKSWEVIIPDFGTYEAGFLITSVEFAGEHNGEATYTINLESSGAVTFTAA